MQTAFRRRLDDRLCIPGRRQAPVALAFDLVKALLALIVSSSPV
jgi:hypothetical protein